MTRTRAAAVVATLACCAVLSSTATAAAVHTVEAARTAVYRKTPTVSCLRRANVAVTAIRPLDRRLRALRDLAQTTSWQASSGGRVVGVSINRTANDAAFLVELLRVPNTPYRLERRANAVLVYLSSASTLATRVRSCLA